MTDVLPAKSLSKHFSESNSVFLSLSLSLFLPLPFQTCVFTGFTIFEAMIPNKCPEA